MAHGNSVTAIGRIDKYRQGGFSLELTNDNILNGINVNVKVIAVTLTKIWKDEYYTIVVKEPIKEKQTKRIPNVTVRKAPVILIDNK